MSATVKSTFMLLLMIVRFVIVAAAPLSSGSMLGLQRSFTLHKAAAPAFDDEAPAIGSTLGLQRSTKLQKVAMPAFEDLKDEAPAIGSTLGLQRSTKLQKVTLPAIEDEDDLEALEHASVVGLQRSAKLVRKEELTSSADSNADTDALKHGSLFGLQRSVKLIKGGGKKSLHREHEPLSAVPTTLVTPVEIPNHSSSIETHGGKVANRQALFTKDQEPSVVSAPSLETERSDNRSIGKHLRLLAITTAVLSLVLGLIGSLKATDERAESKK